MPIVSTTFLDLFVAEVYLLKQIMIRLVRKINIFTFFSCVKTCLLLADTLVDTLSASSICPINTFSFIAVWKYNITRYPRTVWNGQSDLSVRLTLTCGSFLLSFRSWLLGLVILFNLLFYQIIVITLCQLSLHRAKLEFSPALKSGQVNGLWSPDFKQTSK